MPQSIFTMKNIFCFLVLLLVAPLSYGQQLIATYPSFKQGNVWPDGSRVIYNYNPDESLAIQYAESKNNAGFWNAYASVSWGYNTAGKLTSVLSQERDEATQQWENDRRKTITYDESNGRITGVLHERFGGSAWINDSKEIWSYDAVTGYQDLISTQIWEPVNGVWESFSRAENNYNNDGFLTETLNSDWDVANTSWVSSKRQTYAYTDFDSVAVMKEEEWVNNAWQNLLLVTHTYNANAYKTNTRNQGWNADNASWKNALNIDFTYNTDETLHQYIVQNWDEIANAWKDDLRVICAYGISYLNTEEIPFRNLHIYPNPAKDEVKILFEQETNAQIVLSDLQGKIITSAVFSGISHTVSLENLSPGMYVLQIASGKTTETRKIVKS